jgi:hypothetical protein
MQVHVDALGASYQGELEIRQLASENVCGVTT